MNRGPDNPGPIAVRRVLVVDDHTAQRLVLRQGLARRGYEVVLAGLGGDALTQLTRDPGFSAAVFDLASPAAGAQGYIPEILRRRRPGMPVVFVTGGDPLVDLVGYPLIGALRKPVRVTDVCDLLDELIEQTAVLARQRQIPGIALAPLPRRQPTAHGGETGVSEERKVSIRDLSEPALVAALPSPGSTGCR